MLLHSFSNRVEFGFPLGLWPIESDALGHQGSVGYELHLIEWALNLIRLGYSHNFNGTIAPAYLAGRSAL